MYPKNVAGIILAGGKGSRLAPLTENVPKPLLTLKGKALIDYSIELLTNLNIPSIYVVTGYLGSLVEKHVQGRANCIVGDAEDNVWYAVSRVIPRLVEDKVEAVIFTDGDSVVAAGEFDFMLRPLALGYDGTLVLSSKCTEVSIWELETDDEDMLKGITRGTTGNARIALSIKTNNLKHAYELVGDSERLKCFRKEHNFIPGFEEYLLGWGLILHTLIRTGSRLKCIRTEIPFRNINRVSDLTSFS